MQSRDSTLTGSALPDHNACARVVVWLNARHWTPEAATAAIFTEYFCGAHHLKLTSSLCKTPRMRFEVDKSRDARFAENVGKEAIDDKMLRIGTRRLEREPQLQRAAGARGSIALAIRAAACTLERRRWMIAPQF